jgi:hypothetical protein
MKKSVHPLVIFLLGMLAGAVMMALLYYSDAVKGSDYQSSVLKNIFSTTQPSITTGIGGNNDGYYEKNSLNYWGY